jgi:hypothetical protein
MIVVDGFGRFAGGFAFTLGALFAVFLWHALNMLGARILPHATDDSDAGSDRRSGVTVITDHKTGLQYLAYPRGGLTPRLDRDGRHIAVTQTPETTQTGESSS